MKIVGYGRFPQDNRLKFQLPFTCVGREEQFVQKIPAVTYCALDDFAEHAFGFTFSRLRNNDVSSVVSFPQLKVCGVTRLSDLDLLAEAGVGAVGLNLVPSSKRKVELNEATQLAARARQLGIRCAAVVMDPDLEYLLQVVQVFDWDYLQLHGREAPSLADHCAGVPVVKAISWSGRPEEGDLVNCWSRWAESQGCEKSHIQAASGTASPRLAGYLVDAYAPVEGGGTGRVADWQMLWPRPAALKGWPVILAGGLHPGNVKQAILQTRCDAVDVASGVETRPGIKSREAILEFARQARLGFQSLLS